ncbi:MAG: hypothetical protein MI746_16810 [Pseudomonadales bacterium]|nr:hypothetical protein [Pseudomonadales bacterium]
MSPTPASVPVYLIDASIYIFQAHFSPYVECYDREGNELSAIYGFSQFLIQFLRRSGPDYVGVAHDESLFCGFRHQLCSDYKSNRELPDPNLEMQLKACIEICDVLGLSAYSSKVYEADDIIGTLATNVRTDQQQCALHIVSKDKDLAQLLEGDHDCLWEFSQNQRRYAADIESEFGVSPNQICDFLALAGDSVDCITGVPGVGPVKARELLSRFEDLEAVYENIADVKELPIRGAKGLADKLERHRKEAELSRTLATIVCDVDDSNEEFSGTCLEDLKRNEIDIDELRSFLVEYRFQSEESERLVNQAMRL